MRKFEVGKEYTHGWACDADWHTTWKVIARTAATVTIQSRSEIKKCRINKQYSELNGAETVKPFGSYSMCPILTA